MAADDEKTPAKASVTDYAVQRAVELGGESVVGRLTVEGKEHGAELQKALKQGNWGEAAGYLQAVGLTAEQLWAAVRETNANDGGKGGKQSRVLLPVQVASDRKLSWDDLILDPKVKEEMRHELMFAADDNLASIVSAIRQKSRVSPRHSEPCRAFLLEGPPGGGKTLTAEVLASVTGRPLYRLSPDQFRSELYSVSTVRLKQMLDSVAAQRSVLFLDEVDSWAAASRSSTTHEETAAQLSVLLEFIDGVDRGRSSNCIVVAATNRPDRVDAALRSRMRILTFPAPSLGSAIEWWTRNAAHLSRSEIRDLATVGQTVAHASFRTLERTARRAEELAALQAQRQRQPQPAAPSLLQYRAALAAAAETALKQQEATRAAAKL